MMGARWYRSYVVFLGQVRGAMRRGDPHPPRVLLLGLNADRCCGAGSAQPEGEAGEAGAGEAGAGEAGEAGEAAESDESICAQLRVAVRDRPLAGALIGQYLAMAAAEKRAFLPQLREILHEEEEQAAATAAAAAGGGAAAVGGAGAAVGGAAAVGGRGRGEREPVVAGDAGSPWQEGAAGQEGSAGSAGSAGGGGGSEQQRWRRVLQRAAEAEVQGCELRSQLDALERTMEAACDAHEREAEAGARADGAPPLPPPCRLAPAHSLPAASAPDGRGRGRGGAAAAAGGRLGPLAALGGRDALAAALDGVRLTLLDEAPDCAADGGGGGSRSASAGSWDHDRGDNAAALTEQLRALGAGAGGGASVSGGGYRFSADCAFSSANFSEPLWQRCAELVGAVRRCHARRWRRVPLSESRGAPAPPAAAPAAAVERTDSGERAAAAAACLQAMFGFDSMPMPPQTRVGRKSGGSSGGAGSDGLPLVWGRDGLEAAGGRGKFRGQENGEAGAERAEAEVLGEQQPEQTDDTASEDSDAGEGEVWPAGGRAGEACSQAGQEAPEDPDGADSASGARARAIRARMRARAIRVRLPSHSSGGAGDASSGSGATTVRYCIRIRTTVALATAMGRRWRLHDGAEDTGGGRAEATTGEQRGGEVGAGAGSIIAGVDPIPSHDAAAAPPREAPRRAARHCTCGGANVWTCTCRCSCTVWKRFSEFDTLYVVGALFCILCGCRGSGWF
jgi:hypothetical protein